MKIKRFLALTLVLCLCIGAMVFSASANEAEFTNDYDVVVGIIRDGLQNHQSEININYQLPVDQFGGSLQDMERLVSKILEEVSAPPYEHLKYSYICINTAFRMTTYTDVHNMYLRFNVEYYIDKQMNDRLEQEMDALLARIITRGMSDYDKIDAIYDWMCDNITYDYANLNDDSHTLKYTAYAALINRTAVCQGYAELLDRLAAKVGVDSCIISGWQTSTGCRHAWNIVELSGRYYNVDATWDINYHANDSYFYFLRCDDHFYDHTRDPEFTTKSFYKAYPMSSTDYNKVNDSCMISGHNYFGTVTAPTCLEQGYTTFVCDVCGDVLVEDYTPAANHQYVATVTRKPTCTEYGERTYKCSACGVRYAEMIDKVAHNYTSEVFPATCTAEGYTVFTCRSCGRTYHDAYRPELGHNMVGGACTRCDYAEGVQIGSPSVSVSIKESSGQPRLSWDKVDGAVKYQVYRSESRNGTYKRITTTSKTSTTNTSAVAGKTYFYYVVALDANGNQSRPSGVVEQTCMLARPTVKLGNRESDGKITISWEKVEGAAKYEVYRATSRKGTYTRLGSTKNTR